MNIDKIKEVLYLNLPDKVTEQYIISIIAKDKNVIPTILKILEHERELKEDLLLDTNLELSRALIVLKDENLRYTKKIVTDPKWVVGEIIKHYKRWKDYINCCFKIKELEDENNNNGTDYKATVQLSRRS